MSKRKNTDVTATPDDLTKRSKSVKPTFITSRLIGPPIRTCAAAGCNRAADSPVGSVPLCNSCNDSLAILSESVGLHWFTCHIDTSFIRWSSHPDILPPTPLPLGTSLSLDSNYTNNLAMMSAAQAIKQADAVLIVAGAGMSCDSGLPDYRGAKGFYKMGGKDIAMDAVNFHPDRGGDFFLSMGFISTMISEFREKSPHEGYHVLHRIARSKHESQSSNSSIQNHFVLTSNIDAYFLRTGFHENALYESHGSCNLLQCTKGGSWDDSCDSGIWHWPTGDFSHIVGTDLRVTPETRSLLPRCPKCNSFARPHISHSTDYPEDVVPTRKQQQEEALLNWLRGMKNKSLVVIEVGCGESIHSLRVETEIIVGKRLSHSSSSDSNDTSSFKSKTISNETTTLIRIDPGNANVPRGHIGVKMKAMEALIGIEKRMSEM
jgi:NAD-dependent SIR2 family protein deacetylase